MAKQWGFNDAQTENGSLVGLFFHSYKEGEIYWQGNVVRKLKDGRYLVQLFSWVSGCPTDQEIMSEVDLMTCSFYRSDKEMRFAWCQTEGIDPDYAERLVGLFG